MPAPDPAVLAELDRDRALLEPVLRHLESTLLLPACVPVDAWRGPSAAGFREREDDLRRLLAHAAAAADAVVLRIRLAQAGLE